MKYLLFPMLFVLFYIAWWAFYKLTTTVLDKLERKHEDHHRG